MNLTASLLLVILGKFYKKNSFFPLILTVLLIAYIKLHQLLGTNLLFMLLSLTQRIWHWKSQYCGLLNYFILITCYTSANFYSTRRLIRKTICHQQCLDTNCEMKLFKGLKKRTKRQKYIYPNSATEILFIRNIPYFLDYFRL